MASDAPSGGASSRAPPCARARGLRTSRWLTRAVAATSEAEIFERVIFGHLEAFAESPRFVASDLPALTLGVGRAPVMLTGSGPRTADEHPLAAFKPLERPPSRGPGVATNDTDGCNPIVLAARLRIRNVLPLIGSDTVALEARGFRFLDRIVQLVCERRLVFYGPIQKEVDAFTSQVEQHDSLHFSQVCRDHCSATHRYEVYRRFGRFRVLREGRVPIACRPNVAGVQ
jgi:hypothetical protein